MIEAISIGNATAAVKTRVFIKLARIGEVRPVRRTTRTNDRQTVETSKRKDAATGEPAIRFLLTKNSAKANVYFGLL
jgi:hypothetical protein